MNRGQCDPISLKITPGLLDGFGLLADPLLGLGSEIRLYPLSWDLNVGWTAVRLAALPVISGRRRLVVFVALQGERRDAHVEV